MSGFLSDPFRFAKIGGVAAALVLLVLYASVAGPQAYPAIEDARRDPGAFNGQKIYFSGDIVRLSPREVDFRAWDGSAVTARARIEGGREGQRISGAAVFRPDGTLDVLEYHIYRFRMVKHLLVIIPLIGVLGFFFRRYRFDRATIVFRDRPGAGEDHA